MFTSVQSLVISSQGSTRSDVLNRRRVDRPIGLRAVKMLGVLRRRARGPARHVAAANARAEVRARMHNWSI